MGHVIAVSPLGLAARWSARSQEQARRNAMAAHTALTARRHERLDVQEFVTAYLADHQKAKVVPSPLVPQIRYVG